MSDELQNAATIASLRAEVERLKAELQGEREDLAACRAEVNRMSKYADRLLAENVRLSNDAAELRAGIEDARRYCAVVQGHWDTARERAVVLEAEVRAWRHHDDVHECEPMTEYQMRRSIDAHDDACRAAQETDRTHALDAAKFGGAT